MRLLLPQDLVRHNNRRDQAKGREISIVFLSMDPFHHVVRHFLMVLNNQSKIKHLLRTCIDAAQLPQRVSSQM